MGVMVINLAGEPLAARGPQNGAWATQMQTVPVSAIEPLQAIAIEKILRHCGLWHPTPPACSPLTLHFLPPKLDLREKNQIPYPSAM